MNSILEQIGLIGIVPVVVIDDEKNAEKVGEALSAAGLPCAEVTFRTSSAAGSIMKISKKFPELVLGAGTVLSVDQAKAAVGAGAKFIVSPGLNGKVVEYCLKHEIPVTPGVATPTEIERALEYGLEVVKFFPAEQCGGLAYLRAISAPYNNLRFIPTGGIDETNLLSYLKFPKVLACGGSWMVSRELISKGSFDEIRRLAGEALSSVLGLSLRHLGMNMADAPAALKLSGEIAKLFMMNRRDTEGSLFVGEQFEVMKSPATGKHGHIAISTNFIERAISHFERNGIKIVEGTKNVVDGKLRTVYLDIDLGGFAVHLVQI